MCRVLGVTRQGHCRWLARPVSAHDLRDAELAAEVAEAYGEGRRIYGAPKVLMRLRARGVPASRKRVARLMRENGMRGVTRACARRPTGEKRAPKQDSHEDLVGRDFTADGPNEAWFADITYVRTRQGWLYLAIVMDVWSRMIVGWSMGPRITAELADDALRMAIARRRPAEGRMRHSGHGAQRVSLLLGKTMRETASGPPWAPYRRPGTTPSPNRSWASSSPSASTPGPSTAASRQPWRYSSTSSASTTGSGPARPSAG